MPEEMRFSRKSQVPDQLERLDKAHMKNQITELEAAVREATYRTLELKQSNINKENRLAAVGDELHEAKGRISQLEQSLREARAWLLDEEERHTGIPILPSDAPPAWQPCQRLAPPLDEQDLGGPPEPLEKSKLEERVGTLENRVGDLEKVKPIHVGGLTHAEELAEVREMLASAMTMIRDVDESD